MGEQLIRLDAEKLGQHLLLRGWSRERSYETSGLSRQTGRNALDGKPVRPSTAEIVREALGVPHLADLFASDFLGGHVDALRESLRSVSNAWELDLLAGD